MPLGKLDRRLKSKFVSRRDWQSCRVYRDGDQGIPNAAWTPINFSAQRWDYSPNDDIWAAPNTTRLTCRRAGIYVITGHFDWAGSTAGTYRGGAIRLNGITFIAMAESVIKTTIGRIMVTTVYSLSVGDYVELCAYQDTGGNLNVMFSANYSPEFMMARVG